MGWSEVVMKMYCGFQSTLPPLIGTVLFLLSNRLRSSCGFMTSPLKSSNRAIWLSSQSVNHPALSCCMLRTPILILLVIAKSSQLYVLPVPVGPKNMNTCGGCLRLYGLATCVL